MVILVMGRWRLQRRWATQFGPLASPEAGARRGPRLNPPTDTPWTCHNPDCGRKFGDDALPLALEAQLQGEILAHPAAMRACGPAAPLARRQGIVHAGGSGVPPTPFSRPPATRPCPCAGVPHCSIPTSGRVGIMDSFSAGDVLGGWVLRVGMG